MYIVSWTVNYGENNLEDLFLLFETEDEADSFVKENLCPLDHLHCWAVSKVLSASEPDWMEDVA